MKRLTLSALLGAAISIAGLAAGCGGGGGSTPTGQTSPAAASKTVSVAVRTAATFFTLGLSNTSTGRAASRPASALQLAISYATKPAGSAWRSVGSTTYESGMGLYMTITSSSATSATATFYTDAAGNNPVGTMKVTMESAPGALPAKVRVDYNISGGTEPVSGTMTVTIYDSSGTSGNITGNISTSTNGDTVKFSFNLTMSQSSMSGSLSVQDNCVSVSLTNVAFDSSTGAMDADITANGLSGTVHLNADGSGSVTLNGSDGVTTAAWNADGSGTITHPNGQVDNVANFYALDPCS